MLKALIFTFTVLVSLGLVYAVGAWVLLAMFGLCAAALVFSMRELRTSEEPAQDDLSTLTAHGSLRA